MNTKEEHARLRTICERCNRHALALRAALQDIEKLDGSYSQYLEKPDREVLRLLDQFAYRYTRLQDETGAKLIPAILAVLGEDVAPMPAIDRFNRMEQLGWLLSADEWIELRLIRNEFTHDYPEDTEEHAQKFAQALKAAKRLLVIFEHLSMQLGKRGLC